MKTSTKRILTIAAIIIFSAICQSIKAQTPTIDLMVPVKTFHFDRDANQLSRYAKNEGGNGGLVISITSKKNDKLNTTGSVGYVKNSYGEWSLIGLIGKSYRVNSWLRVDVNVGFASGYTEAYYDQIDSAILVDGVDPNDYNSVSEVPEELVISSRKRLVKKEELSNTLKPLFKLGVLPVGAISAKVKLYKNVGTVISVNPYYINAGISFTL